METPSLVAGIGIGIAIGIMLGFVISPGSSVTATQPSVIDEIIETVVESEPRFVRLNANYDNFFDKTTVVMIFTDNDGNNVKTNGATEITLCFEIAFTDDLINCFSNQFTFEKDDFYTWQDSSGRKFTAAQFVINQELSGDWYWHATANIVSESGLTWVDVDTRFWASED